LCQCQLWSSFYVKCSLPNTQSDVGAKLDSNVDVHPFGWVRKRQSAVLSFPTVLERHSMLQNVRVSEYIIINFDHA